MSQTLLYRSDSKRAAIWEAGIRRGVPDLDFRQYPEIGDPAAIDAALVWNPPPGLLASLPNLKLIISLGAGIDHLLGDPALPRHLPIMRLVDPHMVAEMSEFVTMQVLRLHRHDLEFSQQQRDGVWLELSPTPAAERRVGILGLGEYGSHAARTLRGLGFDIGGWSRTPKTLDGIACFHGSDGFRALLARTDILVCLLPLTAETTGILDHRAFAEMPRGAMIVNVGRGGHLVEGDLLAALDSGQIGGAALDVFATEPLPTDHKFWRHPRVIVTPHIAAMTNPTTGAALVADGLIRLREGRALRDIVDLARGY